MRGNPRRTTGNRPPLKQGRFSRVFDVRAREWPIVGSLAAYFFFLTSTQHLLKPARNALFLSTAGSENLPWVYISTAGVSAIVTLLYGQIASTSRHRQTIITLSAVAASLVLFWMLLQRPTSWVAGAFYVWINVFSLLLVSQFFLLGNEIFDPRQAKRLFGLIGGGGLVGGIVGSATAGFVAEPLGTTNLVLVAAALLGACLALVHRIYRLHAGSDEDPAPTRSTGPEERSLLAGLGSIRSVPHLRRIAQLIFLTVVVSTFVDWMFNALVESEIPGREAQTAFFGRWFAVFNTLALVVQFTITSVTLRTLGLAGALVVLPALMGLGITGFLFVPGLVAITASKGADMSFRNSLDQSARELLYLPIPAALRIRAKPFIDVVVARGADGFAGVLILLGTTAIVAGTGGLAVAVLVLIGLWLVTVVRVRRSYRRALERLLAVRDVDLEEAAEEGLDSDAVRELRGALVPATDPSAVHYTLDLLRYAPATRLREDLVRLLDHADPSVRARAIERLTSDADPGDIDPMERLLDDPDPRVRGQATILVFRRRPEPLESRVLNWLESEDPHELEAALVCLLEHDDEESRTAAAAVFERLLRDASHDGLGGRLACARAIGQLEDGQAFRDDVEHLLADGDPGVVAAAIGSAEKSPRAVIVEPLLPHLERTMTRRAARRAMAAPGNEAVPRLSALIRDRSLPADTVKWLPSVFVEIDTRAAFFALAESVPFLDRPADRLPALKGLNKLRRRHPSWSLPESVVGDELDGELLRAYEAQRHLATTVDARDTSELSEKTAIEEYAWALGFHADRAIERAFRLQALLYSPRTIYFAYAGLTDGRSRHGAHAIELLETTLDREDARRIIPLIDPDRSVHEKVEIGRERYSLSDRSLDEDVAAIFETGEPWLQAYAEPLASELGIHANAQGTTGDHPVTRSIVEKATALRRTDLMSKLGADDLLQLAAVAEEQTFEPGEHLFYEGEDGDYLFVLLDGEVRGELGSTEVFRAGAGEAIGTFSILDGQPRSASAVAVDTTHTLAIHRADMAQIMADNYSLVEGLFKHLTGIIRDMNEYVFPTAESDDRR